MEGNVFFEGSYMRNSPNLSEDEVLYGIFNRALFTVCTVREQGPHEELMERFRYTVRLNQ